MYPKCNKIIHDSKDWQSLKAKIATLSNKEKGDVFELFTKYFLQTHPNYISILKEVWLFSELTIAVKKGLKIPSNDQGIDLVALTNNGEYWAIQCKYVENENQRLSHDYISTFGNLAFAISGKFTLGLVCTTAERFSKAYNVQENISFCTSEVWRTLNKEQFDNIRNLAANKPIKLKPFKPFPHQQRAIANAVKHYIKDGENRGKLILPCGSGKSLTGFWIAEKLKANTIIVAVPSLALVKQTLNTWLREAVVNKMKVEWICVCSDESIGNSDDVAVFVQDLGIPSLTNVDFIAKWMERKSDKMKIVFTTYQSGQVVMEATKRAKFTFDLGILDEAHKTVGQKGKLFSHLLYDENISIRKRVFMTATERRFIGSNDDIASMDDVNLYGGTFELLTFKEALEVNPPILSDYRIITVVVNKDEVKELIDKNVYVKPNKGSWNDQVEIQTLTSIVALRKAMQKFPINHAVSFHSSIARAKAFEQSQITISEVVHDFEPIETFHVTGATPTFERNKIIEAFANSPKALITNARCLTEGVDVPNIDCVLFADPKKSTIDIVQAVGRALRISKGKQFGYVIIPVLADELDGDQIINDDSYSDLLFTLRALASNDSRIIEYFKLKGEKGIAKKKRFSGDELIEIYGERIDLEKLVQDVELRVWNRLAKLNWRPFNEAREFVNSLNLKNGSNWNEYCKSGKKPQDIPADPRSVYKNDGWIGQGDWLGTGTIASRFKSYKPFDEAREYVQMLVLRNNKQWREFSKSVYRPEDIPSEPQEVYKDTGWKGYGDWLGTGRIADRLKEYIPYNEAREFVQSLNFKNFEDWKKYCKSGKKPQNIPAAPHNTYKNNGWISQGDWLGTGTISNSLKEFRPFNEAREYVQNLGLKNQHDWIQFYKSGKKPIDIPSAPHTTYKNTGWKDYGDWLGTGTIANRFKSYKPFDEAREYVRKLKLNNTTEWQEFSKSSKMPRSIPTNPMVVYKGKGWSGMGDWLGTGNIAPSSRKYKSFNDARKFVNLLAIKGGAEWRLFCKSDKMPEDIPAKPERVYKDCGWKGYGDWLGTGNIAAQNRNYRSFNDARKFVKSIGLINSAEWKEYVKSGNKPEDIPSAPQVVYKNKGWKGYVDWLRDDKTFSKLDRYLPYDEAKKFIHSLNLKSNSEWIEFVRSGKLPKNIPGKPERVFKGKGWNGLGGWLGTGKISTSLKQFKSFYDAKEFVHSLGFISTSEWKQYCKSGRKPKDIPSKPDAYYKNKGWKGYTDWLRNS